MISSRLRLAGLAKFRNEPTNFVSTTQQQRAKEQEATQVFISAFDTPPSGSESSYGSGGPSVGSIKFAQGLQDERNLRAGLEKKVR
jgi:hypothetical protein